MTNTTYCVSYLIVYSMRVLAIITTLIIVVLAVIVLPQLPYVANTQDIETVVFDIWHIETSEGGSGSRRAWLSSTLSYIEKQNVGLYINIYTYTVEQMCSRLQQGYTCDIVSFGMGAGQYLLPYLQQYTGAVNTLSNLTDAGCVDNAVYALPYMGNIYGIFGRQSDLDSLGISDIVSGALDCSYTKNIGSNSVDMYSVQCGYSYANNPLQALVLAGVSGTVAGIDYDMTQYMAYENFVGNNYATLLLGTARDVYRVGNRVVQGRLDSIEYQPLSYTDLVQYIAIMDTSNSDLAVEIIEYLTCDSVQLTLSNIGLLATTSVQPYSSNSWLVASQQALWTASTVSVFCDDTTIDYNRDNSLTLLGG